jgi:hypothetical protein
LTSSLEHRLTLRQDQHLGRELDIAGTGGDKAEQRKGVMEEIGRRVAVAPIGRLATLTPRT